MNRYRVRLFVNDIEVASVYRDGWCRAERVATRSRGCYQIDQSRAASGK